VVAKKRKPKIEYWLMHWYGTYQVCDRARTYRSALRKAKECERLGGNYHDIWKCEKKERKKKTDG
jgi:hypothetical protein